MPHIHPQNCPFPFGNCQSQLLSICLIPGPSWPIILNSIQSAILPQCTRQTDWHTNREMVQATKPLLHTHTHTQPFYCSSGLCPGPPGWAGTRKVKPGRLNQSGFTGVRDSEWQWHLLGYMQVRTSSQTTTSTSHHSVFLQAGCPSCRPTNSVKALKARKALKPVPILSYVILII